MSVSKPTVEISSLNILDNPGCAILAVVSIKYNDMAFHGIQLRKYGRDHFAFRVPHVTDEIQAPPRTDQADRSPSDLLIEHLEQTNKCAYEFSDDVSALILAAILSAYFNARCREVTQLVSASQARS